LISINERAPSLVLDGAMEVAMSHSLLALPILASVLVSTSPLLAATDNVPKFDIDRSCRSELSGGSATGETIASCKAGEEKARNELGPRWSSFSTADKKLCIQETQIDGSPSYVELETCLDMTPSGQANR
jgi:hypothetical protein